MVKCPKCGEEFPAENTWTEVFDAEESNSGKKLDSKYIMFGCPQNSEVIMSRLLLALAVSRGSTGPTRLCGLAMIKDSGPTGNPLIFVVITLADMLF